GWDEALRGQALVGASLEQEADEVLQEQIVGRHGWNDVPSRPLPSARVRQCCCHGAGMRGRTVEPDDLDTAVYAPRNADRQIPLPSARVVLVQEAEGRIIGAPLEVLGKERRERLPDAIRNAAVRLGADGAVFEVLNRIGVVRGAVLSELP